MTQTKVVAQCVSKKQSFQYSKENPTPWEIELEVPYDQNSIYWKMSGGTNIVLNTINQEAANMFEVGENYDINISKSQE